MKVYVLRVDQGDSMDVCGIYSSQEKAQDAKTRMLTKNRSPRYYETDIEIEDWELDTEEYLF
jgi:hypothetical protein